MHMQVGCIACIPRHEFAVVGAHSNSCREWKFPGVVRIEGWLHEVIKVRGDSISKFFVLFV